MKNSDLQLEGGNYTRIVNKVIEELVKVPLLGAELAICLFVIRKTYGFNKKEDQISLTQFEQGTGRSRPTITKALKKLQLVNMVQLVKSGDSKISSNVWRFNKYYESWKLVKTVELVKNKRSTSKEKRIQLVKVPLHTKETTKENKRNTVETSSTDSKKLKELKERLARKNKPFDRYLDPTPRSLQEFTEAMRKPDAEGKQKRPLLILANYAEEKNIKNTTRGQWNDFIDRNIKICTKLSGYSDERIANAVKKIYADLKSKSNPQGFITKWTLETVQKYLE